MSDYITYNHSVCNINYHFVWVTKYRKNVLYFDDELKHIFQEICNKYKWMIKAIEIMPDHIHIFITTPPFDAPSKIAKLLKGISARKLFINHPELKRSLWGGHLWSASYYCGTAGKVSGDVIRQYIENQKTRSGVSSAD